jgi:arginase
VEAALYQPDDHRSVNIRNMQTIALHAVQLADAIEEERRAGRFVLVLGGDCSLLVGATLANARLGQAGLIFIDGHTDFYLPEQSGTGGAAGMDLALVTGWGPQALVDLEGRRPLVNPRRVSALGNRDFETRMAADLPAIEHALGCYLPLPEMRRLGALEAMRYALEAASPDGEPYWIHLDVDVLDGAIMPSVDSPQPGGLSAAELERILALAVAGNAAGMQVTIYDPDRDPEGAAGALLVNLLVRALGYGRRG